MKVAVSKCQEIIAWRKLDLKKYNSKKRPLKSILTNKPEVATKLEFVESPTSTVSITPEKVEQSTEVNMIKKAFVLASTQTSPHNWRDAHILCWKEKGEMQITITKLEKEKNQLNILKTKYFNLLQSSNKKVTDMHKRLYNINENLVKAVNDMSFIPINVI